jgi:RNA polymerase sigma-70 factor (ECF subfamily)
MRSASDERSAGARLGELYTEHSTAVFAYAYHLLGTREDAEDVTQVAFLHAHRALLRGEEIVSPRAWLSTVVKRQAFNRWRDQREVASEMEDVANPNRGDAAEQLSRVRAVLYTLPEAQHQAFVLRHWCGLGPGGIAEVLGTTESAVESLLVRARSSIIEAGAIADACVDVRDRLAAGESLTPVQHGHVGGCSGCSRAQRRLTRVAAAAVALELVPRAHVAQALAATVPGFAGAGGAASGAGVAAKLTGAKVAASLLATTVAATAIGPVAVHHLWRHRVSAAAPAHPAAAAPMHHAASSSLQGRTVRVTAPVVQPVTHPQTPAVKHEHHARSGDGTSDATDPAGGGDWGGDTSSGQSPAENQQGDGGSSSGDGTSSGQDQNQNQNQNQNTSSGGTQSQDGSGSGSSDGDSQ